MWGNYIKTGWRHILKNKRVFSINIFGLALGIAACLLIFLFVKDELSYDQYNAHADQIVRVVFNAEINGEKMKEAVVMAPVAKTLKNDLAEVKDATRIRDAGSPKITYNGQAYRDTKFAYVDPNIFEIFSLPLLRGNTNPLQNPNTVVISSSEAKRYFGEENAIGKTIYLNDDESYHVTAVMKDIPSNSHFHFDMLASMNGFELAESNSWVNSNFFTYLLLEKGTNIHHLESKLPGICEKYMGPQMKAEIGMSFAEFTMDNEIGLFLQPLKDIHLHSDFIASTELEQGGNIQYLYIFGVVAIFMLLIACINFMNLSTATASKRAKEVGIRKVLGSNKKQLIYQFLAEAFISVLVAMIIAFIISSLAIPLFNNLSGKSFATSQILKPEIFIASFGLIILITMLAGIYPAFFLSSFRPISALKSKFSAKGSTKGLRSGLVVFQFVISAGLILGTLVVNQQMNYVQNKELGYNKDQILVLRQSYLLGNDENAFKNEILKDTRVQNVSKSAFVPAGESDNSMSGIFLGDQYQRRMYVYNIDENYIPTMGMKIVQGRNFSENYGAENDNVIINEAAAKSLGFGNNAIGQTIFRDLEGGLRNLEVIGVVKNFHFKSLHQQIDPLIMLDNPYGGLILRAKTGHMAGLLMSLKQKWNDFDSAEPFSYTLLDDSYNKTYLAEQKMGDILNIFAILTIIVACLGLFGLVTFTAEQRFKEIGIRKVLGSSAMQIVTLLSKDFIKLVSISFVIAFPVSYYFMNKWLQDFAYRIDIHWWLFVLAAFITLGIALLTIGFKSFKAATINPVKSLKTE